MLRLKQFKPKLSGNTKGFTLIEIAIVLVIIGLILGAAVKGKDLIQSAKQKKFFTSVLKAWELTVVSYYDRTGGVLGDGTANGGTAGNTNGNFDGINGNAGAFANVIARLTAVGLTDPTANANNPGVTAIYSFKGQFSGNQNIILDLLYNGGVGSNLFRLRALPTDLAIALDTMVDGQAGSNTGNFRISTGVATWPNATTTPTVVAFYMIDVP